MTEFLKGVNLTRVYEGHNPMQDPNKIELTEGMLLVIRSPVPNEKSSGGVIIPVKDGEDGFEYKPNCSRVVAVGPGVGKEMLGRYAFWVMNARSIDDAHLKPQPTVFQYTNTLPHLWTLHEKYVLFTVPHGGDPKWIEVKDTVTAKDTRDEWTRMSANWIAEGTIFKDADGVVWQALPGRMTGDNDDTISVYATPRPDLGA
jgi:hypothetical protein